jgi:ATP-binding cassette subfamily A (ABC1) protein 1
LSVKEHLELYARLKGVPRNSIDKVVQDKLVQLDLKEFEFKLAHTLSGGNKRKLSVAIALIGSPPIIFLDEPSTGMDPVARRFMWRIISEVSTGKLESTIILTTHSMEECEALCTKVGIMVAGRFRCMGNVQHLKAVHGQGFTVEIKTKGSGTTDEEAMQQTQSVNQLERFFREKFAGSQVIERNPDRIVFKVPQEGQSVSRVFRVIEEHKEQLNILEYSCSQTSLEQIFNYFANQEGQNQPNAPGFGAQGAAPGARDIEMAAM